MLKHRMSLLVLATFLSAFLLGLWMAHFIGPAVENAGSPAISCRFRGDEGNLDVKLEVLDVIRGREANEDVARASPFNEGPPAGYEYLLVRIKVTLLDGRGNFSLNPLFFRAEFDGEAAGVKLMVYPRDKPLLRAHELSPGESESGWLAFVVRRGSEVKLQLRPLLPEPEGKCLLNLGNE